jgi:hypothetical protein
MDPEGPNRFPGSIPGPATPPLDQLVDSGKDYGCPLDLNGNGMLDPAVAR